MQRWKVTAPPRTRSGGDRHPQTAGERVRPGIGQFDLDQIADREVALNMDRLQPGLFADPLPAAFRAVRDQHFAAAAEGARLNARGRGRARLQAL